MKTPVQMRSFFFPRLLLLTLLLCALGSPFVFKDPLAAWLIKRNFEKALPGYALSLSGVSVSPRFSSVTIDSFHVWKKPGSPGPDVDIEKGSFFAAWSPWSLRRGVLAALRSARLDVSRLSYGEIVFSGLTVDADGDAGRGGFFVTVDLVRANHGKKDLLGARGRGTLTLGKFVLEDMSGTFCGGVLKASAESRFGASFLGAEVRLIFQQVRMEELVRQLEMDKKVDLTGVFSGQVDVSIGPGGLADLSGHLDSEGGGRLAISDSGALKQSLGAAKAANLVVENFENYDYDIGEVIIGKEDKSLKVVISLDGAGGRRHLEIYWHVEEK